MANQLTRSGPADIKLRNLLDSAQACAAASMPESTRKAYRSDWRHFTAWCAQHALQAMPANAHTVALYAAAMADNGKSTATIRRHLAAIAKAHKLASEPTPVTPQVRELEAGIRRTLGTAPK